VPRRDAECETVARPVGIRVPIEDERAADDEVARHAPDAEGAEASQHEEGVLVDQRWVSAAFDDQVPAQLAVEERPVGEEVGLEAMARSEALKNRQRRCDLVHRGGMHGSVGGLGREHRAVLRFGVHALVAPEAACCTLERRVERLPGGVPGASSQCDPDDTDEHHQPPHDGRSVATTTRRSQGDAGEHATSNSAMMVARRAQ